MRFRENPNRSPSPRPVSIRTSPIVLEAGDYGGGPFMLSIISAHSRLKRRRSTMARPT